MKTTREEMRRQIDELLRTLDDCVKEFLANLNLDLLIRGYLSDEHSDIIISEERKTKTGKKGGKENDKRRNDKKRGYLEVGGTGGGDLREVGGDERYFKESGPRRARKGKGLLDGAHRRGVVKSRRVARRKLYKPTGYPRSPRRRGRRRVVKRKEGASKPLLFFLSVLKKKLKKTP